METWDLESVYDEQIAPLMAQVIAICKKHRLPMFASFAYGEEGEDGETLFCTTSLPFGDRQPDAFKRAHDAVYRGGLPRVLAMTITSSPASAATGQEDERHG